MKTRPGLVLRGTSQIGKVLRKAYQRVRVPARGAPSKSLTVPSLRLGFPPVCKASTDKARCFARDGFLTEPIENGVLALRPAKVATRRASKEAGN